jgi:hypothetical protein
MLINLENGGNYEILGLIKFKQLYWGGPLKAIQTEPNHLGDGIEIKF